MVHPRREELTRSQVAGLGLVQEKRGYRFSLDPFLLAAFSRPRPRERILDLGAGVGVLSVLLARRSPGTSVLALELQPELARLARRNFLAHGLDDRCAAVAADLRRAHLLLPAEHFHRVVANPPFRAVGSGRVPPHPARASARAELHATLEDFARAASGLLRYGGSLDLVHVPARLAEVVRACSAHSLEPKILRLVSSFPESAPVLMLLSARKGGRPGMTVLPALTVRTSPGCYSEEVAAALVLPSPGPSLEKPS